jgi:low temperature requirement protein LtrA
VGGEQAVMARDAYALLHLPMIAGVVLFALGVKKVLGHPEDPLKDMPAVALCGGLAIFALAQTAFRLRTTGSVAWPRLLVAPVCLAVIPLAMEAPALATLGLLALIWTVLISYETIRYADLRAEVRAAHAPA